MGWANGDNRRRQEMHTKCWCGKRLEKCPLGGPRKILEDNIKRDHGEADFEEGRWTELAQDRAQ